MGVKSASTKEHAYLTLGHVPDLSGEIKVGPVTLHEHLLVLESAVSALVSAFLV